MAHRDWRVVDFAPRALDFEPWTLDFTPSPSRLPGEILQPLLHLLQRPL